MTDPTALDPYRYRRIGPIELYLGDACQVLAAMPDASADRIVTSPPFWSLRDHGTGAWRGGDRACPHPFSAEQRVDSASCGWCKGTWIDPQYGLGLPVDKYVDRLVAVFDEAMRVLNSTGTLWLNLGDSYTGGTRRAYDTRSGITGGRQLPAVRYGSPLPATNLIGVP